MFKIIKGYKQLKLISNKMKQFNSGLCAIVAAFAVIGKCINKNLLYKKNTM